MLDPDTIWVLEDLILQKGRKKNEARDIATYLNRELAGKSGWTFDPPLISEP